MGRCATSAGMDGEVLSAARQAERLRHDAGAIWFDIVFPSLPSLEPPDPGVDPFGAADFCLDYRDTILTAWEVEFCRSVGIQAARGGQLTDKQIAVLRRCVAKCRLTAKAGAR